MKIECLREKLGTAVAKAEKVTGKHLSLPVLSCILLEAKDNSLKIRATNLDLGVEIEIPVKVEVPGAVAVPGNILSSFVSGLKDDKNIILETVEGNLSVSTNANSTLIKCQPIEDFPTIPVVEKEKSFEIGAADFARGLKAVWYSSATSSMKPELSSVYVYCDDASMVFAATDSFRLAEKKIPVKKAKDFNQILIPFKNVPEIVRSLEDIPGDVEVVLGKNQLSLSHGGMYLVSRIVDGAFPDYKAIIAKEFKTEVVVLKQDLLGALKLSNIFSDKFNQVNLKVDPGSKKFEIKTKNNDVGENSNKLQAVLSGEALEVNFNYKYIMDCFQSIDTDSVSLSFNGNNKAMVMRPVGDQSFTYVVMPMNR